jgi:hypothetical protein
VGSCCPRQSFGKLSDNPLGDDRDMLKCSYRRCSFFGTFRRQSFQFRSPLALPRRRVSFYVSHAVSCRLSGVTGSGRALGVIALGNAGVNPGVNLRLYKTDLARTKHDRPREPAILDQLH